MKFIVNYKDKIVSFGFHREGESFASIMLEFKEFMQSLDICKAELEITVDGAEFSIVLRIDAHYLITLDYVVDMEKILRKSFSTIKL